MQIRPFQSSDRAHVIQLWHRCGLVRAWNDPNKDIDRKLEVRPDLFLVGILDGKIIASVMAGYEGHRGWLNYLAVDPDFQGVGHGRTLVEAAERTLLANGCPKVNLQVRAANKAVIDFYKKLGYGVDDVVSMGKRLIDDEAGR